MWKYLAIFRQYDRNIIYSKNSTCFRNRGKFIINRLLEFSVRVKNFYGTYKCMCCNSQVAFHSTINFILVIV